MSLDVSREHVPAAESSFIEDGYRGACSCGWRDRELVATQDGAIASARAHVSAAQAGGTR